MSAVTRFDIDGDAIPYTPTSDVVVGVPQQIAGRIGIPLGNLEADKLESLQVKGIFVGKLAAVTVVAGDPIGFDADGDPYGGTTGSGCYTNASADWDFKVGTATEAATATSGEVNVVLNVFVNTQGQLKSQVLDRADFADNGDDSGYIDFDVQLPIGAIPAGFQARTTEGFTGDTSAALAVGITGNTGYFTASSQSVFGVGVTASLSPLASADGASALVTVRVTVTGATDFGLITAGSMTIALNYIPMF